MGIRFRRRVKIFPGITLNISKSGVSTTLGVRGLSVTKGHGVTRTNIGIPGSGISYNNVSSDTSNENHIAEPVNESSLLGMMKLLFWGVVILLILLALMSLR